MNSERNLKYLERFWLEGTRAISLIERYADAPGQGELMAQCAPSDGDKWRQQEFDHLLSFYSIVEIGTMIGFVDGPTEEFRNKHLPVLSNAAVRRYYEWERPRDLPRRLRERMQSGVGHRVRRSARLNADFYEFLELAKAIDRDEGIICLLTKLDQGWREPKAPMSSATGVGLELNPTRLAKALQVPPNERDDEDQALNGFCRLLQYIEALEALLSRLGKSPVLAEAMWLAQAHWLRPLEGTMGEQLKGMVRSMAQWDVEQDDKERLLARVVEIDGLLLKVANPPMGLPQAELAQGIEDAPSRLTIGSTSTEKSDALKLLSEVSVSLGGPIEEAVLEPSGDVTLEELKKIHASKLEVIRKLEETIERLQAQASWKVEGESQGM